MLSIIKSFGTYGIEGYEVLVEIDINQGLPGYEIVGLVGTSIKESKERVRSAIKNSGFNYPINKIIVNLAPANTKKDGPVYDLAIAVGILSATKQVDLEKAQQFIFLGELSLNGNVRMVNGVLPILIAAKQSGFKNIIIPYDNLSEASCIKNINVFAVKTLKETIDFLNDENDLQPIDYVDYSLKIENLDTTYNLKNVAGQTNAKRALEIAAAGGHNILLIGPPGSGKTLLAKCFPSILPNLTFEEALEVTKIHSVAGVLDNKVGIIASRPFRSPHHTATTIALTGGGRNAKPGELSLSHNGVLFLDELPEYSRNTIEVLRQPLEDGVINVSRLEKTIEYPANFTLIASMNPCPCGNYGNKEKHCKCTAHQIHKYLAKLSGPLMDRIDMHIEVDNVNFSELRQETLEESSESVKERVDNAKIIQLKRYEKSKNYSNSKMSDAQLKKFCKLDNDSEEILKEAFESFGLSARAYSRILKVSRTIADLENAPNIELHHLMEAISYRALDKKYWNS